MPTGAGAALRPHPKVAKASLGRRHAAMDAASL